MDKANNTAEKKYKEFEDELGVTFTFDTTVKDLKTAGIELKEDILQKAYENLENKGTDMESQTDFVKMVYEMAMHYGDDQVKETVSVKMPTTDDWESAEMFYGYGDEGRFLNGKNQEKIIKFVNDFAPEIDGKVKEFREKFNDELHDFKIGYLDVNEREDSYDLDDDWDPDYPDGKGGRER